MVLGASAWALLACLLPLAAPFQGPAEGEGPVVRVAQGLLRGRRIQRPSDAPLRTLYAFEGVPYAKPPVGHRRFKDPEEPISWNGIRNATSFGPVCIQQEFATSTPSVTGEEDCLFLNIYTADPPEEWPFAKRPVIVYFHGGSFVVGSGNTNLAHPDPLLQRGIVFVTVNYRLGAFGFLNTEDDEAPGNAGLKDQVMALHWVKRNIAKFGGHPNSVTIMGESSGGSAVHFHIISPTTKNLFQRAVSVSGSALLLMEFMDNPRRNAEGLRDLFADACADLPKDAIVRCLQRINATELALRQFTVPIPEYKNFFLSNLFYPAIEAAGSSRAPYLSDSPIKLLKEGKFARVPYITGFTSAEGIVSLWLLNLFQDPSRWAIIDHHFEDIFMWTMPPGLQTREAVREVRKFYLGDRSLDNANEDLDTLRRMVDLFTDIAIALASISSAQLMAKKGAEVYLYEFTRDGPIAFNKDLFYNASRIPGVAHGDDMAYVFDFVDPATDIARPIAPAEQPIRDRQANIFANLATYGNPTPPDSGLPHWPVFQLGKDNYMDMGEELIVRDYVLEERLAFWRRLKKKASQDEREARKRVHRG